MNNQYTISINCVVLSTDITNNKQFVLSLSKDSIEFPNFLCDNDFLDNQEIYLSKFLKKYIFVNEAELMPQLICIDSKYISDNKDRINLVYGFVTSKTTSISDDVNWFEFSYQEPNPYSNILFEVTQKLK